MGGTMKTTTTLLRTSLLTLAAMLAFAWTGRRAAAQDKPEAPKTERAASSAANREKFVKKTPYPAAKAQAPQTQPATEEQDLEKEAAPKVDKDSVEQILKRDAWFYKQRASADGRIPPGARARALEHMRQRMLSLGQHQADAAVTFSIPQVTNTWTSIGPAPTTGGEFSPVTGRITTIAVDPADASGNTVLIGGAQGGIWRTTNAGLAWTAVGDQNASLAMGSIAFANSTGTVYAGTGEQASIGFDIYYGAGVLKSTDHGLTWAQTCTTPSATCPFIGAVSDQTPFGFFTLGGTRISYISVNPTNANMVLVGAQTQFTKGNTEGVYCTDDGGGTWHIVPTAAGEMSTFVGFTSGTAAFAALGDPFGLAPPGNGIYQATGIGATCSTVAFSRLTAATLPAQSTMGRIDIGISPNFAADKTIYASIANAGTASNTNLGVFVSTDGGTTWTATAAPDICQQQCWYDNVVKVDPNGGAHAFFAGSSVFIAGAPAWVQRTANTGGAWSTVVQNALGAGLTHVDNHAIAFAKLASGKIRMYLGNDGGIWRTDDAEATPVVWTNLNDSLLTLTQFYPALSIHPSNPGIAFGGTQDNGSQNYTGALGWADNNTCGDGTGTSIDTTIPSTVYVACNGLNIAVSTLNGVPGSFIGVGNGINGADASDFVPPLSADPNTANRVYAGSTKVYQSVDGGFNFTALSVDLVNGANGDDLTAISVAPGNSSVVYAAALGGGVFVATNVGAGTGTFAPVAGQASLPSRMIRDIAIDARDATGKTAYVAVSGFAFGTDTKGHVFETKDGGTTWTDVSCTVANCATPAGSDLPNTPVNDVVVDPDINGVLYAATDIGVYIGVCSTAPVACTWSPLSTGLPHVAVLSLKLHHASRTLRAATHGRGMWDIVLNNFTFTGPHISSISPVSALAGSPAFTLTVNGNGLTGGAVNWNGATTGVTQLGGGTDTRLTASIAASLITGGGTPPITVKVGANTSNALTFTVLGGTPTLTSINPTSTPTQTPPSAAKQVVLTGTGFSTNSQVLFNGLPGGITTSNVTSTSMTATLPAALLGPTGSTNDISVLNPPPGGGASAAATFVVQSAPPANDNFASATVLAAASGTINEDTSAATSQATDPILACVSQATGGGGVNGSLNTVWFKFVPTSNGTLEADTIGSSYDTTIGVFTGSAGALTQVPNACNDDINPGVVVVSQITGIPLTSGTTYFIMVGSFGVPDPNPIALGGALAFNYAFTGAANPVPTVTTLSPTNINAGSAQFTLTVNGTNFVNTSVVNFGAAAKTTTFVNANQLTATILAADVATAGPVNVTVTNPAPGGGTSTPAVIFTVNVNNPVPTVATINPTNATAGGAAFTLNVTGTNFINGSVVNFNGVAKTTTFVDASHLTASILAADIATAGTPGVTVTNPAPGGGTSTPAVTFTVNNPVPTVTTLSPTNINAGSGQFTLTVNGTNFVNGSVVKFGGATKATTFVSANQLTATILAADVATAGTPGVTVTNAAPGGGTSTPAVTFTVNPPNNPLPTVTTINPTSGNVGGPAFTLTVNGTGFVNASVVNFAGAARTTTFVSATQLTASILAADIATTGAKLVTVTSPAPGGGTSVQVVNFAVNNPLPTVTTINPTTGVVGGAAFTLTVNGTGFLNTSVVNFAGTARTTTFVSSTQVTAAILAADIATVGAKPVTVTNAAPGGGTSTQVVSFTVTNPLPTVTTLSPTNVTAGSGQFTLTVNGTNFVNGAVVNFGGAAKATAFVSANQLTATILASDVATAGTPGVTVTNPAPGGGTSTPAVTFTVNNPVPTVTTLSPTNITAGAGQFTLTVNGTNFVNGSVVNFGGAARATAFVNANQLTATILASDVATAGTPGVTVTNGAPGGGTSTPAVIFTVNNPLPTVTTINPTSGVVGGPAFTLTVNGTGFVNASVVSFAGTPRITTFVSATQVTAAILAADLATTGAKPITVTSPTPGGGTSVQAVSFAVNNPLPTVTTILPATGLVGGPAFTLTVNGTGFLNTSVVNFAGAARITTFVSSTQITAAILAADIATVGAKAVTVTNAAPGGGTSTQMVNFTVTTPNPVPTVTTLSPTTAQVGGGAFTLTVNGTNFVSASVVNFAGAPKTTTFVSATQLTASILAADIAAGGAKAVTVTSPAPGGGTSTPAVNFTVTSGSFTLAGTAVTVPAGGAGVNSTITATPTGNGFTGTAAVTCTTTNATAPPTSLAQVGITCTPNPLPIGLAGSSAQSNTLTIAVTGNSIPLTASNVPSTGVLPNTQSGRALLMVGTGTGFAGLFLLLLPGRRRLRAAMGLGLVCIISLALGCSNGGGGGGPVATHTTITAASTKVASTSTGFNFTIAVTGGTATPTGMVQLFEGNTAIGTATAIDNTGMAHIGILPASGVGTHAISAHYTGDAGHMASASGALNCTVTGQTLVTVSAPSGANTVTGTFSITVN
jgi:hypothetical protein